MATIDKLYQVMMKNRNLVNQAFVQFEKSSKFLRDIHHIEEGFQRIRYWLEVQPRRDRESLTKLAHRGWFLGPNWPVSAISVLGRQVEVAPHDVDEDVGQYIGRNLDIEARLVESYPHRSKLLQEGFWAHRKQKYALSIPLFLAQADGLFYDRFQENLFRKRGREDAAKGFTSEVKGLFFRAVLYPLSESTPLWEDSRSLEENFGGLNRHQVLHGMKVDYDTEISSLKAISLLDYLNWVLNRPTDRMQT